MNTEIYEVYRFVGTADLDDSQVQFNVVQANGNTYVRFSILATPLDVDLMKSILVGTAITFEQNGVIVGAARVAAKYDETDGLQIDDAPEPALADGRLYAVGFTQGRPGTAVAQLIPGEKGWSPEPAIVEDGSRLVFQIRYVDGEGTPPQGGYVGASGIVTDIAQAVDLWEALRDSDTVLIPDYDTETLYRQYATFTFDGALYRTKQDIPATNTKTVAQLLSDDEIEQVGLTLKQTEIIARVGSFDIRDFRDGVPTAPTPDADAAVIALAKKTIGIGKGGVTYIFEEIRTEATWIDFENDHWEFEQTEPLPQAALQTGDFYYIPNNGTGHQFGRWYLFDGTKVIEYDNVGTFLPNHLFLGNFSSAEAAVRAITNYDSGITYLAYFPTTVEGRTGREMQQLAMITNPTPHNEWIASDEELHKLILVVEEKISNFAESVIEVNSTQAEQDNKIAENRTFYAPPIANWERDTGTGTLQAGHYRADRDTILISRTDVDGTSRIDEFGRIQVNQALGIGDKRFVITGLTTYNTYTEFEGFWVGGREDATANNVEVTIGHLAKTVNYGDWISQASIYALLKTIIKAGSNITVTHDDDTDTITLASSGGGGGSSFSILAGDGPPASNLGNDGDFYREKDDGTVWRKVSGNWVEVIDLATEDELQFVKAMLDELEKRVEAGGTATPRRVDHLLASGPKGDLVYLTRDTTGPAESHEFKFYPYTRTQEFGISRVNGLAAGNLQGRESTRDWTLITGDWTDFAQNTIYAWGLDNNTNYLRAWHASFGPSFRGRATSKDKSLGAGNWIACAATSNHIYVLNGTGNVITVIDINSLETKTALQYTIGGSDKYVSIAERGGKLYLLNDTQNRVEVLGVETTGALTAETASNITLSSATWAFAFVSESIGSILDIEGGGRGDIPLFVVNSSNQAFAYNVTSKSEVTQYRTTLPGAYVAGISLSTVFGSTLFLDNTANKLVAISLSRRTLPSAVFDDDGIAAIWIPRQASDPNRYKVHVAYKSDFPDHALDRIDWQFRNTAPLSGSSPMVFLRNETHGGKEYAIYVERNETREVTNDNFLTIAIALRFGDSGFIERDGTYSAHLARKEGLYNVFDVDTGYERAVVNREPVVLLEADHSRSYVDIILPENYREYKELLIVGQTFGNRENSSPIPTSVLSADLADFGDNNGTRIQFALSTRTISRRAESGNNHIQRFIYAELR